MFDACAAYTSPSLFFVASRPRSHLLCIKGVFQLGKNVAPHPRMNIFEACTTNLLFFCPCTVQTFFISAIAGSVTSQLANMLNNPSSVIAFLATSLPAQSSYFIQFALSSTFVLQAYEMLRIYPLSCALLRRCIGPRLTRAERRRRYGVFYSLYDPPEFASSETLGQITLFYIGKQHQYRRPLLRDAQPSPLPLSPELF